MFLLLQCVSFFLFVIQLQIIAWFSVFAGETRYTSESLQCKQGILGHVDTCLHHDFHYNFVLNLAAALRVLIFPSFLTDCYQIFHCSAFPTAGFHALLSTVISPALSFSAVSFAFPYSHRYILHIVLSYKISFFSSANILIQNPLSLVPHPFYPSYPVCMLPCHTALLLLYSAPFKLKLGTSFYYLNLHAQFC